MKTVTTTMLSIVTVTLLSLANAASAQTTAYDKGWLPGDDDASIELLVKEARNSSVKTAVLAAQRVNYHRYSSHPQHAALQTYWGLAQARSTAAANVVDALSDTLFDISHYGVTPDLWLEADYLMGTAISLAEEAETYAAIAATLEGSANSRAAWAARDAYDKIELLVEVGDSFIDPPTLIDPPILIDPPML